MGSGKTTLGSLLAERTKSVFFDLDAEIERRAGVAVRDLFARGGEPEFRRAELAALRRLAADAPAPCVVATGGGVVESAAARTLLRRFDRIVWLRADPQVCVARLGAARADRPLLAATVDWRRRWRRREPLYRALADATVDTHPDDVTASLAALLAAATPAANGG